MTLSQSLGEYISACFTGLWVQSHEHSDALVEIARLCKDRNWSLATWDIDQGLQMNAQVSGLAAPGTADPLAAIKAVGALAQPDSSAVLVLPNFHRFLQSTEVIQALAHQIQAGKTTRSFIVVLSPVVQIPLELEKHFVVIDHELPDRAQLEQIARGIATEDGEMPAAAGDLTRLIDAAAGLTRYEAEGAYSLSLVRHGKLEPQSVWELKSGMLKKSGLLSLHRGSETFADLGGLDGLKSFCTRALSSSRKDRLARPRGILLLSPPGCGKSQFIKSLGNETGRPTLVMDVGAMYGSLVGQTEQQIRQALKIADAMAPCVLFIDEADKALSGLASSGQGDSGVSARLFGTLLTYLSDHSTDVFVAMTANDISKLPPELSRAERFDGVFFLDLPAQAERARIWPIHLKRYAISAREAQKLPEATDWTGAEIQSCCRLASLLDLPLVEAARNVVPVAVTAAESVQKLRAWASGRCLDAGKGGIYSHSAAAAGPGSRRVARTSSN